MSADADIIKDQMREFSERMSPTAIIAAVVLEVNEDGTFSCEFADGSTVDDVRLKAVVKEGNQFIIVPTPGSNVLLGRIGGSDEYVLLVADEINEFLIEIGDTKFVMNDKFLFKKGEENLLTIMSDMLQAIIDERHMTNSGPTISLTPDSVTRYTNLKTRFENLLNNS